MFALLIYSNYVLQANDFDKTLFLRETLNIVFASSFSFNFFTLTEMWIGNFYPKIGNL